MKKQLFNVLTKIGFLSVITLVTTVGAAHGQSLADKLRARIPFDFIVADKKLPAGVYYIGRANVDAGSSFLLIRSLDGHSQITRPTTPVSTLVGKNRSALVFHRYGEQYFLFQVWPAGATTGRAFPRSRSEREILRKLRAISSSEKVARRAAVETVIIAGGLQ